MYVAGFCTACTLFALINGMILVGVLNMFLAFVNFYLGIN